jgi:hypothetical protein
LPSLILPSLSKKNENCSLNPLCCSTALQRDEITPRYFGT